MRRARSIPGKGPRHAVARGARDARRAGAVIRDAKHPGVPLEHYRSLNWDVILICLDCQGRQIVELEAVISRLEARGTGGAHTGVRELARHVCQPCAGCGGRRFETRPYRP
jgi:hypothetical protein